MIRCGRRWWIRSQKEPKTCSSVVPHRVTRGYRERRIAKCILQSPVGHVSHGGRADALEQSESSFQMLSRERRLPTKNEHQAGPGLLDAEAFLKRLQVGGHRFKMLGHERGIAMVEVFFVQ